jgi:nicotinamide riboside transporter PnuC
VCDYSGVLGGAARLWLTRCDGSSWRIPIAINLLWVVLLAGALLVVPESRE